MTKEGLVNAVCTKTGMASADSKKAVQAVIDTITEVLKRGDSLQLTGFGTFSVEERAAREGRNPATGEKLQIPAKKVAKWKPSTGLVD